MADGTSVPRRSGPSVVLLECPANMAAASPRASGSSESRGEAAEVPLTQSLKMHIIISTSFCSLEATHHVQPILRGRGIRLCLLKEYQRIYGHFLEPPHTVSVFSTCSVTTCPVSVGFSFWCLLSSLQSPSLWFICPVPLFLCYPVAVLSSC